MYSIHCTACEVECPTGALSIKATSAHIDGSKCIHCKKCLTFHDFGCITAASLAVTGTTKEHKMKLISYNNFGLNEGWLSVYFSDPKAFFVNNLAGLNVKEQMPSFAKWLYQAGIIADTKTKEITPLGRFLADSYADNNNLVWQIIWINLSYEAPIVTWYNSTIEWNTFVSQQGLEELVANDYADNGKKTIHNVVYAFARTMKESPLGEFGPYSFINKNEYQKKPFIFVERAAIAYSLYKYSEVKNIRSLNISDLYSNDNNIGVYKEFGISKEEMKTQLRSLNSDSERVLIAELNMGLENITLRENLNAFECLRLLAK